jgi:curved DNA-binding protein CbpA
MKDINEAFEILSDLEKRRRYHSTWLQKSDVKKPNPQPPPSATPKADYKETVSSQPSRKNKDSTSYMDSKLVVIIWILLLLIVFLIWLNTR